MGQRPDAGSGNLYEGAPLYVFQRQCPGGVPGGKAMEQFALNFAPDVTVPEPQRLREKVKNALEKALEKYN